MKNSGIKLLIVEDNPADSRLVAEMLREKTSHVFQIIRSCCMAEALKMLETVKPDIILLDINLPDSRGLEGLEDIVRKKSDVPIIVLTGADDENMGMQAIQRQASDYLVKGKIDTSLLVRSIRYAIERKKAEEILKRDNELLERLVMKKARELTDAQNEIDKTKRLSDIGTLAATVAHEIRNPLSVIRTAAFNIRRKSQDINLKGHLDNIDKKVLEANSIINNLLRYSRITAPHLERSDLYKIISDCLEDAKNRFDLFKINVKNRLTPIKDVCVDADPVQIREVFDNLLNNAYEAFPEHKSGNIEVSALCDKDLGVVRVTIKDDGAGIPPEIIDKIHEPFFTTKSKGTGLGLAVSFQIVDFHKGKIEVASDKIHGTIFTVTLPLTKAEA